jgi:SAM-dependent methyltransferase
MSELDRKKWNRKYRENPDLLNRRSPSQMVKIFSHETEGGNAIDLACGSGRNALYLASIGYHVDAVDIAATALDNLKKRITQMDISLIEADLESFIPQKDFYDLAVMSNYLDRNLVKRMAELLKKEGIFIIETYMKHPENMKKETNPDFLLDKEELIRLFDDRFDILEYREFWNETHELYRMRKQGIAVKKK